MEPKNSNWKSSLENHEHLTKETLHGKGLGLLEQSNDWSGGKMNKKKSNFVGIVDDGDHDHANEPKDTYPSGHGKHRQKEEEKANPPEIHHKSMQSMRKAQAELKMLYLVVSSEVKPGQTSERRSFFATLEKDLDLDFSEGLSPLLVDEKVRSTTLDTWLPEQVAFMASMGNEKANIYWEAKLPTNYDRRAIEKFIRAKYEEKRWVGTNTTPPIARPVETSSDSKAVRAVERNYSRKTRSLSLEEAILTKHAAEVSPSVVVKSRGVSFDMKNDIFISPSRVVPPTAKECLTSTRRTNGTSDIFNLVYVQDAKKDRSAVTPSTWATFDCKTIVATDHSSACKFSVTC
ncbi:hypothetical protein FNV43_RR21142 [Rhamnella rubrinervis]|uniref:Arf-GAP domain-containing protein n=1 Tax=Rhamnella rubrinervis TaxID=2594499 RepID=A0A8K0DW55_9ROSA|nr:hypothetical protein FNV43_RR21142 [Rhamnella rubrinervis]